MGLFKDIKNELVTVVSGVQKDGQAAFEFVVGKGQTDFNGYPSVSITPAPGGIESDYSTNVHNHRRYLFDIHIINPIEDTDIATYDARTDELMDLVDLVLDALEATVDLNNVVDFIDPVPTRFFETSTARGPALVAPVRVVARKDVLTGTSF